MRRLIRLAIAAPILLAAMHLEAARPPETPATDAHVEEALRMAEEAVADMEAAVADLDRTATTSEAQGFMADYAAELRRGDRAAIAARYDRRGVFVMGGGRKRFSTHAETVAQYAGPAWQPPAAFEWRDLDYEALGPDAVAVVGTFLWTRAAGEAPRAYSYTALLVRQDGALRIRIEDEDPEPAR